MLLLKCILIVVISIAIKDIQSEELVNTTAATIEQTSRHLETTASTIGSSTKDDIQFPTSIANFITENDIKSSTLENLTKTSTNPPMVATAENVSNLLNLKNFSTTLTNLSETISSASAAVLTDFQDNETTPSWELIYPEQNSSTLEPASSSSNSPLFSTSSAAENSAVILPKYFKVDDVTNCQKYFGPCLRQILSNIVPKLKDGSRSLNLPSVDPIYFNASAFQYNSGPFTGYITIRYAHIYGLTSIKFKKVDFNKLQGNKFTARLSMLVPKMYAIGSYKGDMNVNNVRVRPRGNFNVTMSGLGVEMVTLGSTFQTEDHKFLKLTKSNATTTLKDSRINATGIFPDQRLNDIVVNVANQYWRDLFNIVLPETRNNWLPILSDTLNAAFAMVPFDFLK